MTVPENRKEWAEFVENVMVYSYWIVCVIMMTMLIIIAFLWGGDDMRINLAYNVYGEGIPELIYFIVMNILSVHKLYVLSKK